MSADIGIIKQNEPPAAKVYMPLFSCYNNRYAEFMDCVTDGDEVHG